MIGDWFWIMTECFASARSYKVIEARRLMRNDGGRARQEHARERERRAGKQGKIHGGEGWLERDAAMRGREESGRRRRVEKGDGEVRRGMGGGRRLPRLKWNIDLWRRAQPLQPTRPCPPFSADLSRRCERRRNFCRFYDTLRESFARPLTLDRPSRFSLRYH